MAKRNVVFVDARVQEFGTPNLGPAALPADGMDSYRAAPGQIGRNLVEPTELPLWGSGLAPGAVGQPLTAALAEETGADAALSNSLYGSQEMGTNRAYDGEPRSIDSGFLTAGQVSPLVLSESEPNNTRNSADSVPLGAPITGALSTSSDLDVFSVMLPAPGSVTLIFDAPTNSSDDYFRVGLHDGGGLPLSIFETGGDGTVTIGAPSAGTYYVIVSSGASYDPGQYSLTVSHAAGPTVGFESEPNGTGANADSLALGSPIKGQLYSYLDIDVFGVEVSAAGSVTLNFDAPTSSNDAYFKLGLYDSSGTPLAQFETGHDGAFIVGAPQAGTYYVAIWSAAYYDSGQYGLTVTHAAGSAAGFESEPNGTFGAADGCSLGVPIKGQLSTAGDFDVFSVALSTPGSLTLTIDVPTNAADSYFLLGLYDGSGVLLSLFETGRDGTYTVGAPAAGTYYFSVSAATYYDSGQYSLTVTNASGSVAGFESEPNDAADSADALSLRAAVKGQLYDSSDLDWFSFVLAGPGAVTLGFDAPTNANQSYFALEVDDMSGTPLASFNTGRDQTFTFQAPAAGTYFIRVGSAGNYDSGQYSLTVTPMFNAVTGTELADVLSGTAGADWISALAGNDVINGQGGNDMVDGGPGVDTMILGVSTADVLKYESELVFEPGLLKSVRSSLGVVEVSGIERVKLTDGLYAFDTLAPTQTDPGGKVWQAAALYRAGFDQMPDQVTLSRWSAQADQLADMGDLGQAMIDAYAQDHATVITNEELVTHLYVMLTGQMPSQATVQNYVAMIGPGKTFETQGDIFAYAASLAENTVHLVGFVGSIQVLDPSFFPLG